jgi:hypothetical protein
MEMVEKIDEFKKLYEKLGVSLKIKELWPEGVFPIKVRHRWGKTVSFQPRYRKKFDGHLLDANGDKRELTLEEFNYIKA